jgi:hypothetical protein
MGIKICKDGTEPGIREAVDYLERRYGIPAKDMHAVATVAVVGQPIAISVSVFMHEDEAPPAEVVRVQCPHCLFMGEDLPGHLAVYHPGRGPATEEPLDKAHP